MPGMERSGIRPTQVAVDLAAVRHNVAAIRARAPGQALCGVVKANAYGHGLVTVGRALARAGVDWLGVALVEEGVLLREAGVTTPILVLGAALAGGYDEIVAHRLTPAIFRADQLEGLARAARDGRAGFHLKIDTGMARLGIAPSEIEAFVDAAARYPSLSIEGVLTHLANADLEDTETNARQVARFEDALVRLRRRGITPRLVHVANSAGVLTCKEAHTGLVRPGLMLYGLTPLGPRGAPELVPAMRWTTRPVQVKTVPKGTHVSYGGRFTATRDTRLATLPVGYADGYPRALGNVAQVLIRGHRAPVVGSVCMDLCMIDVTDVAGVTPDDEVVLMGAQDGAAVTAYELAGWAGTIPYEIVCGVERRVPRVYANEAG
jgi:alanine racemase